MALLSRHVSENFTLLDVRWRRFRFGVRLEGFAPIFVPVPHDICQTKPEIVRKFYTLGAVTFTAAGFHQCKQSLTISAWNLLC